MFWKIILAIGVLGILLGMLVTGISVALPIVNGPHTSWDEAMLGIIPGSIVLFLSFFVFVIGLAMVVVKRKKAA
jgi:Na+-transporting NADH:ubiquinone oxidoreductase subunit NqrB